MKATNSELLLSCIGDINPELIENAERKVKPETHSVKKRNNRFLRLAPIAACLMLVVTLTVVIGNNANWFNPVYTSELSGGTLNFYKSGASGAGSLAFKLNIDATSRHLTEEENILLFNGAFGGNYFTSHGFFSIGDIYAPDKSLIHVEATTGYDGVTDGGMKIIIAATSLGYISDTMIETGRELSEVNGVQVSAGYWITDANSRGEKNIIYLAAFETNGVTVYIECGGSLERSDEIREEIAFAIDTLTRNATIDLTKVTY